MATGATTIRLLGLDALDKNELENVLGPAGITFDKTEVPEGTYGEPTTIIAVVIITVAALKGLTAWLMKMRRRGIVELTSEIEHADGSKERKIIRIDVSSSDPDQVLNQVGAAFKIDPAVLKAAMGS